MQQQNFFSYAFSATERNKKSKQERKAQPKKKLINYIDTKYREENKSSSREEMDKDVVF